jgi:SNF2 family DNA or RNA helicase
MTDNFQIRFTDRGEVKNKLRKSEFSKKIDYDIVNTAYELLMILKNSDLSIIPSLKNNSEIQLFDHQILAAKKVKNEFGGTGILADEVGLGKTVEAGILIKEFLTSGLAKKILILAPPSLIYQWQGELESKFNLSFIKKDDQSFIDVASHDLLIFSHSGAVYENQKRLLMNVDWDMIVIDEAHSLKNPETRKYKLVKSLSKKYILLLTATPIQNNLLELFALIDLIRPGMLGTKTQFKNKYADDPAMRKVNPLFKDDLQDILSQLMVRTTRQQVKKYIKFTDRNPVTRILTPTENETLLYNRITDKIRELFEGGNVGIFLMNTQKYISSSTSSTKLALKRMYENKLFDTNEFQELLTLANQIKIDTKTKELLNIIKSQKNEKFLIFTEYRSTQNYLYEIITSNGYLVEIFNGSMNLQERQEAVQSFKNNTQILIATSAGGEGQNFQFCNNIVNYDLPWNPMKVEQRVGRVHRIGQLKDVNIFNLAYKKTIDAYILELLYTKIKLFTMTLGHLDLLFEDITDEKNDMSIFKEYVSSKNEEDAEKKFSALGENWSKQKFTSIEEVEGFNQDVFSNFSLSTTDVKNE